MRLKIFWYSINGFYNMREEMLLQIQMACHLEDFLCAVVAKDETLPLLSQFTASSTSVLLMFHWSSKSVWWCALTPSYRHLLPRTIEKLELFSLLWLCPNPEHRSVKVYSTIEHSHHFFWCLDSTFFIQQPRCPKENKKERRKWGKTEIEKCSWYY